MVFVLCLFSGIVSAGDTIVAFHDDRNKTLCSFKVELAITLKEQAQGLMYRKFLEQDRGMLFVYSDEEIRSFWMSNTYIPLDMIFINDELRVASIYSFAQPFDETVITSCTPAKYVLEINAGKAEHCGISIGSKAVFKNIFP